MTEFGLEIDKGSGFVTVVSYDGISSSFTIAAIDESLIAGSVYKFRYRAKNVIGWGPYSDYLTAALVSPPAAPSAPIRDDDISTKTSIGVRWTSVIDGPGIAGKIQGYKLY